MAGSSLKVPGTKRIVREFAKAVQSTRTSAASSRSSTPGSQAPPSTKGRNAASSSTLKPPSTSDKDDSERTLVDSVTPQSQSDTESSQSSYDLVAHPPRTIYLNLDFPVPTRDWKGVFDVWVQGDVQHLVETFMNALQERDKNQGSAEPVENSRAKSRSRKRKSDTDNKEKPSAKKRKVAADSITNSVPQSRKRKSSSRLKVRIVDDDEDASPEMVAARSLLALSVSSSSPAYDSDSTEKKRPSVRNLQSQQRTSTTIPSSSPTLRGASVHFPSSTPFQAQKHRHSGSGSSFSHDQQLEVEVSPRSYRHPCGHGPEDRADAKGRGAEARAGGYAVSSGLGESTCGCFIHHLTAQDLTPRCFPPDVSNGTGAPTSDLPISHVLPSKKRARSTKQSKTSGMSIMDGVHIDPMIMENGSAALMRTMSLGLRDRASPRDK